MDSPTTPLTTFLNSTTTAYDHLIPPEQFQAALKKSEGNYRVAWENIMDSVCAGNPEEKNPTFSVQDPPQECPLPECFKLMCVKRCYGVEVGGRYIQADITTYTPDYPGTKFVHANLFHDTNTEITCDPHDVPTDDEEYTDFQEAFVRTYQYFYPEVSSTYIKTQIPWAVKTPEDELRDMKRKRYELDEKIEKFKEGMKIQQLYSKLIDLQQEQKKLDMQIDEHVNHFINLQQKIDAIEAQLREYYKNEESESSSEE